MILNVGSDTVATRTNLRCLKTFEDGNLKHFCRYFFATLIALCLAIAPTKAVAQEASNKCRDVLASPPFNDMLTRNDGHDFHLLHAPSQGALLVGLTCSLDVLTEYFEAAGWELTVSETYETRGPSGYEIIYYSDQSVGFCMKRRRLMTFFLRRCSNSVGFLFFEGKISFIHAGGRK